MKEGIFLGSPKGTEVIFSDVYLVTKSFVVKRQWNGLNWKIINLVTAESESVSHLTINYFGAMKAAVDTPFALAFFRLFCSLALTNFSYVSLMDLGVLRSFQQRCWNFFCFHFGFLWHSLTIQARYHPVINKKICFDVEAFLWIGKILTSY